METWGQQSDRSHAHSGAVSLLGGPAWAPLSLRPWPGGGQVLCSSFSFLDTCSSNYKDYQTFKKKFCPAPPWIRTPRCPPAVWVAGVPGSAPSTCRDGENASQFGSLPSSPPAGEPPQNTKAGIRFPAPNSAGVVLEPICQDLVTSTSAGLWKGGRGLAHGEPQCQWVTRAQGAEGHPCLGSCYEPASLLYTSGKRQACLSAE